jgi:hypothetical protein
VHITIRSLAREGEIGKLLQTDESRLRFFACDLTGDAGWARPDFPGATPDIRSSAGSAVRSADRGRGR